jgi:hypothetical protein
MTRGPRSAGNGTARLAPEHRERVRALVVAVGPSSAARLLGTGRVTLERADDPCVLLPPSTVRRLDAAIRRLDAASVPPAAPAHLRSAAVSVRVAHGEEERSGEVAGELVDRGGEARVGREGVERFESALQ